MIDEARARASVAALKNEIRFLTPVSIWCQSGVNLVSGVWCQVSLESDLYWAIKNALKNEIRFLVTDL